MTNFTEVINDYFPKLAKFTPLLANVHGMGHPELEEVRYLFKKIHSKVLEEGAEEADLSPEFLEMRLLTNNYDVPTDGCETYAATYRMLKEADQAYHETR